MKKINSFVLNDPRAGRPKNARPQLLNIGIKRAVPTPCEFNRPLREWFRESRMSISAAHVRLRRRVSNIDHQANKRSSSNR
jgi:hypothetical protein